MLAAGLSRRMGSFKQLLPLDRERTVIEVVVERVRASVSRVIVVLGHRASEVASLLAGLDVATVLNPRYAEGMLSSVQCGVSAAGGASGYLICLADQPGIAPATVTAILAAASSTGRGIVVPTHQGRRGHPVYIAARYRSEILALGGIEGGLRLVTRGHPSDTLELPVESAAVLEDMDTPQQYQQQLSRWLDGRVRDG
ncbi:MAG: nucleotidyltransferase family protein [Gemmatimonadota bacterium]